LGIVHEEAAALARKAGLTVIMDKCMKIESERLEKEKDIELEAIHDRRMQELKNKVKKETSQNVPLTLTDDSFEEAIKKHSLMLVDCWAAWCGPCRMVAPVVDELARDYAGRVTVAKLNVDENPKTAEQFCVVSIPTLLVMKNGNEVDRMVGVAPKQYIEEKLRKYL
jgi:thioredoxin 1